MRVPFFGLWAARPRVVVVGLPAGALRCAGTMRWLAPEPPAVVFQTMFTPDSVQDSSSPLVLNVDVSECDPSMLPCDYRLDLEHPEGLPVREWREEDSSFHVLAAPVMASSLENGVLAFFVHRKVLPTSRYCMGAPFVWVVTDTRGRKQLRSGPFFVRSKQSLPGTRPKPPPKRLRAKPRCPDRRRLEWDCLEASGALPVPSPQLAAALDALLFPVPVTAPAPLSGV